MIQRDRLKPLLFFAIMCILLISCDAGKKPPLAEKGVLDLSGWSFEKDGIVNLDGQWKFYWQQLLAPDDFLKASPPKMIDYFNVPGRWDGRMIDGVKQTGDGYATFRLEVRLRPDSPVMAVRIPDEATAYRMWINGAEVARNGVVGDSRASMKPQFLVQIQSFPVQDEFLEVVLQVSNFHHKKGGVWCPVEFGNSTDILNRQQLALALEVFLFGSLMVMGFYYMFIFLLRRKEYAAIYFSLFCFLVATRTAFTNTRFFSQVFPLFSWEIFYRIELLTAIVTFPVMLLFIRELFPRQNSSPVFKILLYVCAAFSAFALVFNASYSSYVVIPYQIVLIFIYGYITYVLIRAVRAKREGAGLILFGMTVLYATIVNDALASNDYIYTPLVASLGMLVLVMAQSFGLSKRFVKAFSSVEALSAELEGRFELEYYLHQSQKRLSEMLDTVGDSIVAVDEAGDISFCNLGATELLGMSRGELVGRPLNSLFPGGRTPKELADGVASTLQEEHADKTLGSVALLGAKGKPIVVEIELSTLDLEEEDLAVLMVRASGSVVAEPDQPSARLPAMALIEELNRNRHRLQVLEDSLGDVLPKTRGESTSLLENIKTIDSALEQLGRRIETDGKVASKKQLAVDLMNLAVDYWTKTSGMTKADLARQSRQWKVHTDLHGGERTQTLTRYLTLSTLPKFPRWNNITNTVKFVLASTNDASPEREKLEALLTKLLAMK